MQVFVETLDKHFENVCELDLIFHSDRVHFILDEIIMGGMVLETNKEEISMSIEEQKKLEQTAAKQTTTTLNASASAAASSTFSAIQNLASNILRR